MAEQPSQANAEPTAQPVVQAEAPKAPNSFRVLLGEKIGMTQIFNPEGERKAVTAVKVDPCTVLRVKTKETDGYLAIVLGYGRRPERNTSKPLAGQFRLAAAAPAKHVREFRVSQTQGIAAGQIVDLTGRFSPGDYVDIQGVSKGKGFAGVMKRHHFRGLPASHGASDKERSPGSLTARRSLGRVLPGQRMAGHMGNVTTTVQKLEIVSTDLTNHILYLEGSVPGAKGSLISIQETIKRLKSKPVRAPKSTVKRDKMGNIIVEKASKAKKK